MSQRRVLVSVLICVVVSAAAWGHLCNDVFLQARDNLVVKVDVRDGQLRIGRKASFNVYVLNTMDRDIDDIQLEVSSGEFAATVRPDPTWRSYPKLPTAGGRRGRGRKQYFIVNLQRKPGVPDGKYKIGLRLASKRKRGEVFKTVDLNTAAGVFELPKAGAIAIDGTGTRAEWERSYLCTGFYSYGRAGRYNENMPARHQSRFRILADEENLYCLLYFHGGSGAASDKVSLYAAPRAGVAPVKMTFDRVAGTVACSRGTQGVELKASSSKPLIECRIPRALLGIEARDHFYLNVTREIGSGKGADVSYWRGNPYSISEPIVYGHFRIAE